MLKLNSTIQYFQFLPLNSSHAIVSVVAVSSQTGDVVLLLSCQLYRCDFRPLPVTELILWKWRDLGDWRAWTRPLARMPERAKERLLHWLVQSFPPKQQSVCQDWWHTVCFGFWRLPNDAFSIISTLGLIAWTSMLKITCFEGTR